METLWQDLKYAGRMLRKTPAFTAIAVLTLALGIGANTAIFSVVNAVLLEPLPFPQPERLMNVWMTGLKGATTHSHLSYPDFADLRAQNHTFEHMASYNTDDITLTGMGDPYRMTAALISPDLFPLLGVSPQIGRSFVPEEDNPPGIKGNHAVMLSHRLWQQRFGSDPKVIGRVLILNGRSFTVVGVMPAGFEFPIRPVPVDVWITHAAEKETADGSKPMTEERGAHYTAVIGRLKPGVSREQAQADMVAIAANLEKQYHDTNAGKSCEVVSAHEDLVGNIRPALLILFGAVGCVLLIACVNVANLLLARATTRQREMAIRTALGAGRRRVIRQLLTESVLLGLIGGLFGIVLALWGTDALIAMSPTNIPRLANVHVSAAVLGFTFVLALVTGVLFGLAPAFHGARAELTESLKEGGRGTSAVGAHGRIRSALVIAEMALALVLMVGAGLAIQTFRRLEAVNPGFDASHVLTMSFDLPAARYGTNEQIADMTRQMLSNIQALPGVRSASMSFPLPLNDVGMGLVFNTEERPVEKTARPGSALHIVHPGYFQTMGIPIKEGRDFAVTDTLKSPPVVIINETFAKRFFPNEDPIGKRIAPSINVNPGDESEPMREIVGIVGDVRFNSLRRDPAPEIYGPEAQLPFNTLSIVIRSAGDPAALTAAVRETVRHMDPDMPIFEIQPISHYVEGSLAPSRFNGMLLGVFSAIALVLTAIGLYGVTTYSVGQRTQEIGIRVALGAQPTDVFRLVVGQGLRQAGIGLVLGLAAAFAITRTMTSLLYGVTATDPPTFGGTSLLLLAVACAACYIPARRATQVDPLVALRYE